MSFLVRSHRQICRIRPVNFSRVEYVQRPISPFEKPQIRQFSNQNVSWIRHMYDKSRVFFATHFVFGETAMSRSYTITLSIFVIFGIGIQFYAAVILDCFGTPMDVNRLPLKDNKLGENKQKEE